MSFALNTNWLRDQQTWAMACLLYDAILELEYVQCAEDHSQCASAKGAEIVKRGMEILGVKDLSAETLEDLKKAIRA